MAERDTVTDRQNKKRVSGAAAMLILTPIPRLGPGVACGQSQWASSNASAKRLAPSSCLVVLVWSCLAWSSKAVFVVCTFGKWSHRPPPRPELLFDAPALTGHPSARPGNPSDTLQELARACKRHKTPETRQSSLPIWADGQADSLPRYYHSRE